MNKLNTQVKLYLVDEEKQKIFGEGPYLLLKGVEQTGSLRKSTLSMGMAYTKAHKIIKTAEDFFGVKLLIPTIGGNQGGGSILTPECKELMSKYEIYSKLVKEANAKIYEQVFSLKTGCVIMASGLGQRFGGNKLMADFGGNPMLHYILDATNGMFDSRVVVTRDAGVAAYCEALGVKCILHDRPFRSDTVRLGLECIGDEIDVCTFCLADQPLLRSESLQCMLKQVRYDSTKIYRMRFHTEWGNPVTFPKKYFEELKNLPEGKGGSYLAGTYPEEVVAVEVESEWELKDIDTRQDLETLQTYLYSGENES